MDEGVSDRAMPLVSIVTPCLNPGVALEACLESVRGQSYPAIEHIVVDGASTDGTVARLEATTGVRWVSEPDSGQAEAINKGLRAATGAVVTWLCADDELYPEAVARAVAGLGVADAGWVYGDCEIVERDGSGHVRRPRSELSPDIFVLGNPISQPGTFMTAEAMARVGPLDESLDLAFDYDLWLRLTIEGIRSTYVPQTLARFHVTTTSKTGRLGYGPFLREEAVALAKTSLSRAAALRLGMSAAYDARDEVTVTRSRLDDEIDLRSGLIDPAHRNVLRAAARTEAMFLSLPGPFALRHLVAWQPWATPETRRRILGRLRGRGQALIGRRPSET